MLKLKRPRVSVLITRDQSGQKRNIDLLLRTVPPVSNPHLGFKSSIHFVVKLDENDEPGRNHPLIIYHPSLYLQNDLGYITLARIVRKGGTVLRLLASSSIC